MCANIVKKNNDIHNLKRNPLHDKARNTKRIRRDEARNRRQGQEYGKNTERIRRDEARNRRQGQEYGKNTERIRGETRPGIGDKARNTGRIRREYGETGQE